MTWSSAIRGWSACSRQYSTFCGRCRDVQLQDHDRVRLGAEGLGAEDIQEIADLVAEFAPAYATFGEGVATEGRTTVGPDYQFFSGVLREMGDCNHLADGRTRPPSLVPRPRRSRSPTSTADTACGPPMLRSSTRRSSTRMMNWSPAPTATGKPVRPAGVLRTASLGRPEWSVQSFSPIEMDPPIAVGDQALSHAQSNGAIDQDLVCIRQVRESQAKSSWVTTTRILQYPATCISWRHGARTTWRGGQNTNSLSLPQDGAAGSTNLPPIRQIIVGTWSCGCR